MTALVEQAPPRGPSLLPTPEQPAWVNDPDFWNYFWGNVEPVENKHGICLKWTGPKLSNKSENEYGSVTVARWCDDKTYELAHHIPLKTIHGTIPPHLETEHAVCQNKWCVRWDHLELVTHQTNIQRFFDRHPGWNEGENNPNADLTADEVIWLHESFHLEEVPLKTIVDRLGICYTHGSDILHQRRWSHIDPGIPEDQLRFPEHTQWIDEDVQWVLNEYHSTSRELKDIAAEIGMNPTYAAKIVARDIRTDVEITVEERRENPKAGSLHSQTQLTEQDVIDILERYYVNGTETYAEIAEDYPPIEPSSIGAICRAENWPNVSIPPEIREHIPEKYQR